MEFLHSIAEFGVLQAKPQKRVSESEQLARMRENFATRATRQISMIRSGNHQKSGSWYVALPGEAGQVEYVVALRNGAKVIPLSGELTHVRVESPERAVEFYERAISACESGELDSALKATCRKPPKKATGSTPDAAGAQT